MLKLKFKTCDYSNIYFASDFHIDHKRDFLWAKRGFESAEAHAEFIETALKNLSADDLLFFLGDFALNTTNERVQKLLDEIPCETFMCYGNHNAGIKQAYQRAFLHHMGYWNHDKSNPEIFPLKIAQNVWLMGDQFWLQIDQHQFNCSHFAPLTWDHMQHGAMAIFGHSHSNLKGANPLDYEGGKILDCGVENALTYNKTPFFEFREVLEIMSKKEKKILDHHD